MLVTDADQRSSLAVVRSLGRGGHDVMVCDARNRPLAGASRFSSRSFRVPDPSDSPGDYREALSDLVSEYGIDILIPTTDTSMSIVGEGIPGAVVPSSGLERYRALADKVALMEAAPELGIAVPGQAILHGADGFSEAASEMNYPIVVKPGRSAVESDGHITRLGVRIAPSAAELEETLESLPPEAYPVMLQERIVGPGRGLFLLVWNGRLYAHFGHRRLREKPVTGGVSVYRESVSVPAELLEQGRRLLEHFRWNGVAMVEFKEDQCTGRPYLMEVNARFWGSLQLAIDAGVDFPNLLVELASGGSPEPVEEYRIGIRSRWFWGEMDHLIGVVRLPPAKRASMPDLPRPLPTLARMLLPWKPGDRWEVFRPSDPMPFLRETTRWFGGLIGR